MGLTVNEIDVAMEDGRRSGWPDMDHMWSRQVV